MIPSVSVIIPCYNGAGFVAQAIDSALEQTYPPHEVIVVDDGSADSSAEIVASYGPPVRLIRQENKGEGGARNAGAAAARGTHLLFLDADDLIKVDALEQLCGAARVNPDAMILMRSVPFTDDPEQPIAEPSRVPTAWFPDLIRSCIGVPHTWLTPQTVYRRTAGFTQEIRYFVDWEFWCRAALLNTPLVALPYVGALYRRHAKTMSATTPHVARVRGHVAVMETLMSGMFTQPQLIELFGRDLFWCSWAALHRAHNAGVPWTELVSLERAIVRLVRQRPSSLHKTLFVKAIRWLGFRPAYWLRNRFYPDHTPSRGVA
jgi:Glycosyl transferase family 2